MEVLRQCAHQSLKRAVRLYEQEPGEPGDSSRLGLHAQPQEWWVKMAWIADSPRSDGSFEQVSENR